jgi:threonine aldolase
MSQLSFASDNCAPVPPQILEALARVNHGAMPSYGNDRETAAVEARLRALFGWPEARVFLVASGTAANALALSVLCPPYGTVFCSEKAHVHEDECNAPEFYTGGARLTLVRSGDVITPESLRAALAGEGNRGVHGPKPAALSVTNVTEMGNVYTLAELEALGAIAREAGLPVHLDGARLPMACAALDCSPRAMAEALGAEVVVFGGTKVGAMEVEAVVLRDGARAEEMAYRVKRGGHLHSKHRYMAAQMAALLEDDLWQDLARRANARGASLRAGIEALGVPVINQTQANMLFIRLTTRQHQALKAQGVVHFFDEGAPDETVPGRLVCDWSTTEAQVEGFLEALKAAL